MRRRLRRSAGLAVLAAFVAAAAVAARQEGFDDKKGYLHKASGVGFYYPKDWETLDVKVGKDMESLGLKKDNGAYHVTLFWTAVDRPLTSEELRDAEHAALKGIYQDRVGDPEPAAAGPGKQPGWKFPIKGGPPGVRDDELAGVVYIFAFKKGEAVWKIKLRATVRGKDKLKAVEALLDNYRFPQ